MVEINFDSKKSLDQKNVSKKKFRSKNMVGKKKFGPETSWDQNILGLKTFTKQFRSEKIWSKKNLVKKKLW